MILKSIVKKSAVPRFTDSREDDNFIFKESLFYYPPLPKIYSNKSFKIDGYIVRPSNLACSCNERVRGYIMFDDICEHLGAILLTHFSHLLSGFQIRLIKLLGCNREFNSGLRVVNGRICGYMSINGYDSELLIPINSEKQFYVYYPDKNTWKFGLAP